MSTIKGLLPKCSGRITVVFNGCVTIFAMSNTMVLMVAFLFELEEAANITMRLCHPVSPPTDIIERIRSALLLNVIQVPCQVVGNGSN